MTIATVILPTIFSPPVASSKAPDKPVTEKPKPPVDPRCSQPPNPNGTLPLDCPKQDPPKPPNKSENHPRHCHFNCLSV
ncbi:MAG: hypothetical protein HC778_05215 [Chamaesiphon sp. CSU_1_12]|nr:hypothetical protein [Chamaesiphon sp. CSU_1_12]